MKKKYSNLQSFLHLIQGVLLVFVLVTGTIILSSLPNEISKLQNLQVHFILGLIIFLLTIIRIIVLLKSPKVKPLDVSMFKSKLIKFNHISIYVVVILTAISGVVLAQGSGLVDMILFGVDKEFYKSFEDLPMGVIHSILTKLLIFLILMHIIGGFSYKLKSKEALFSRVWFSKEKDLS